MKRLIFLSGKTSAFGSRAKRKHAKLHYRKNAIALLCSMLMIKAIWEKMNPATIRFFPRLPPSFHFPCFHWHGYGWGKYCFIEEPYHTSSPLLNLNSVSFVLSASAKLARWKQTLLSSTFHEGLQFNTFDSTSFRWLVIEIRRMKYLATWMWEYLR